MGPDHVTGRPAFDHSISNINMTQHIGTYFIYHEAIISYLYFYSHSLRLDVFLRYSM